MTIWWLSNQRRLSEDRAAIARLEIDSAWLENVEWGLDESGRLRVVFDIVIGGSSYHLKLTYHNTYPSSPPSVSPVDSIRVSGHQYGQGGDLCLQIRPDNWDPKYTGADMIRSAYTLLMEERPDDDGVVTPAPSEHHVPESLTIRRAVWRLYLSAATQDVLGSKAPDGAIVRIGVQFCGNGFAVAVILSVVKDGFSWQPPDIPCKLMNHIYTTEGRLVRRSLRGEALTGVNAEGEMVSASGDRVGLADEKDFCVAVGADRSVVLFRNVRGEFIQHTSIAEPIEARSRISGELSELGSKRVAIVGLGSIGSKVAVSLARTGVGSFVLVDGDVLHGGNIQRHDADWRDIGLHKTDLVARRVELVAPATCCEPWRTAIGAQVSTAEAGNVDRALDRCELVVDATAEPEAFNHLAGLVMTAGSTLVWGAVYAGGLGGEVGRSRPRKDPSPFDIRNVMSQACSVTGGDAPPWNETGRRYEGVSGGTPVVATDGEVSAIANLLTSLALDALIEREPSRYDAHGYLVGHTRGWIFEGPFHVQPIVAEAELRSDTSQVDDECIETEFLEKIVRERYHDTESGTRNS